VIMTPMGKREEDEDLVQRVGSNSNMQDVEMVQ
jgi:hypothetical protein